MMDFKRLKKADLHCHLIGSLNASEIRCLALRIGLNINSFEPLEKHLNWKDSRIWTIARKAISTPNNLSQAVSFLLKKQLADGVIYVETIINFYKIIDSGFDMKLATSLLEKIRCYYEKKGIKCRIRMGINRADGLDGAESILKLYKQYINPIFVGIDLNGDEKKYPTKNFSEFFKKVKAEGINFTIHAGENLDMYQSLSDAIKLKPSRIGHGIAIINNPRLYNEVISNDIVLEICITSNLETGSINKLSDHPLMKISEKKIPFILSTDDMSIFHTSLSKEYKKAKEIGLSDSKLKEAAHDSINFIY